MVKIKKESWKKYLRDKTDTNYDVYKENRGEVKKAVLQVYKKTPGSSLEIKSKRAAREPKTDSIKYYRCFMVESKGVKCNSRAGKVLFQRKRIK